MKGKYSSALGFGASAIGEGYVALGAGFVAKDSNEFSVGRDKIDEKWCYIQTSK